MFRPKTFENDFGKQENLKTNVVLLRNPPAKKKDRFGFWLQKAHVLVDIIK